MLHKDQVDNTGHDKLGDKLKNTSYVGIMRGMKGRLLVAGILIVLSAPFAVSAAVILEQPEASETQQISGDSPQYFSGASQRTPSLTSLFNATGTVRKATVKFDMLNWVNKDGIQAYLYECPILPGDSLTQCRRVVAMDAAQGWDGSIIHPVGTTTGEFSVDFTKATAFGFQGPDYEDGVPLIPTRGYRLELVFTPNSYTSRIYGVNRQDGGFYPYFRIEGDVPTSTPATTTPPDGGMRGQMRQVLMVCVAVLAVFALLDCWWGLVYILLPTLPLLAAVYPMEWVQGPLYIWWYRFAVPWTVAAMALIAVVPSSAKPIVSTLAMLVVSVITLAILTDKVLLKYYRIVMSPTD